MYVVLADTGTGGGEVHLLPAAAGLARERRGRQQLARGWSTGAPTCVPVFWLLL